jgi:hypothetical protein
VAAGESGGIGVLVVDPDFQAQGFARGNGVLEQGEPFVRQIGRDQAGPGMDEYAADAARLEVGELLLDLGLGHPVVPHPKRRAPELGRRILERLQNVEISVRRLEDCSLTPGRGESGRKDEDKEEGGFEFHMRAPIASAWG